MNEKTKLFVFDKKEVFLLFLFMVVLTITSFTLGVNVGKKISFQNAGYTDADRENIDLKSNTEEHYDDIIKANENQVIEATPDDEKKLSDDTMGRLRDEFESIEKNENADPVAKFEEKKQEVKKETPQGVSPTSGVVGKYTIQLGSYKSVEDARNFADGFSIRGYSPIINEVRLPGRGIWYRVSLGIFENVAEAKSYIEKEQSLFQGQDYVITEIQ